MYSSSDSEDDSTVDGDNPATVARRERIFKPRINFSDPKLYMNSRRFRLTEENINAILDLVGPHLEHKTRRNYALTPDQQVRIGLRYFATGGDFQLMADSHGVSKASIGRTVHRFVDVINEHLVPIAISFPSPDVIQAVADQFKAIAGLPACIGAVDGTHITIKAPSSNEWQFVNRKGSHSINAMVVGGPDLRIYFACVNHPGISHDARVYRCSALPNLISPANIPLPNGYLLGDSAYPNLETLITPLSAASITTDQQRAFQKAHVRTRQVVERTIGLVKARFRAVGGDRVMRFEPVFAAKVIRAVFAVHNITLNPEVVQAAADIEVGDPNIDPSDGEDADNRLGVNRRQQLIDLF